MINIVMALTKTSIKIIYIIRNLFWRILGHVTVGVRCIAIQNNNILLVWHTYKDGWYLPGGGVKKGETLEKATRRELLEETNATVGPLNLFGVFTDFSELRTDHKVVFVGEIIEYSGKTISMEVERLQLFPLDALPDELSQVCANRIREYLDKEKNSAHL